MTARGRICVDLQSHGGFMGPELAEMRAAKALPRYWEFLRRMFLVKRARRPLVDVAVAGKLRG